MADAQAELQRALALLVGEVMRGSLVDPDGHDAALNAAVAEAVDLLASLDTPPALYRRETPPVPSMRPFATL